ncbi:MAG: flagellar motor switch protein FliN [bacterium]
MPEKTPPPSASDPGRDYENTGNYENTFDPATVSEQGGRFDPSPLQPGAQSQNHKNAQLRTEISGQDQQYFPRNLDFILDIPLEISVELGRTRMRIADILKLGQGSIIELSNPAGSALEVLVNHKPIAKGEVVVVNEKYGIRLTEILSVMERIEKLR